jgi:hypothetical protein
MLVRFLAWIGSKWRSWRMRAVEVQRGQVARCCAVVNRKMILSVEIRCRNGGQSGEERAVASN